MEGWLEVGGARGLEEEEEPGLKSAKEAVVSLDDRSDRPACILAGPVAAAAAKRYELA